MKKKLIGILLLVSCIPLLLASLYFYSVMKNTLVQENEQSSFEAIRAVKVDVRNYMETHLKLVRILAQNPAVVRLNVEAGKSLLEKAAKDYPGVTITAVDSTGMQRFRNGSSPLVSVAQRPYFKEAMQGKEVISDVMTSNTTGKAIVAMVIPLRDENNITGIMSISVQLDILDNFIQTIDKKEGKVFIVDNTGKTITHSDPLVAAERKDLTGIPFIQAGLSGQQSGTEVVTDDQGNVSTVHFIRDELTGWLICLETPNAVIMAPIIDLRIKFGIALAIVILCVIPLGYCTANRIVRPITALAGYAKQIAGGDLQKTAWPYDFQDELGELATAFNVMVTNLREMIDNLARCAEQLAASSEQLSAITEQSVTATNQVSGLSGEVAQGADKQAAAVTAITAAVEQVADRVRFVAANAEQAAANSANTAEFAQDGINTIDRAIQQMNTVGTTVKDSARVVAKLGEQSKDIGQIVDTIASIAGQTNLLALNAAIEAARAGEQGRGFAVVAEEVRKLAEQSESAARQIAGLIQEIQGDTHLAVKAMDTGTQEVMKGEQAVAAASDRFDKIAASVNTVLRQAKEISTSINNIATGSDDIVRSIREIDLISKTTVSHTQTVSAATQEQSASFEEIAASCQEFAKMSQELQHIIHRFRV